MYVTPNFKTKKALKEAVAAGQKVYTFQPGGVFTSRTDGWQSIEGPHYPEPHRWYARVRLEDGTVMEVR